MWATRVRHPGRLQLYTFLVLINAAAALEVLHHSCGLCVRSPTVNPHLPFLQRTAKAHWGIVAVVGARTV